MGKDNNDIVTINNTGNVGAMAVGTGATAIQAGDGAHVSVALEAQLTTLEKLIEQHEDAKELTALLKEAIALAKSEDPSSSKPLWDSIAKYGGAIGSVVSGICGVLGLPIA